MNPNTRSAPPLAPRNQRGNRILSPLSLKGWAALPLLAACLAAAPPVSAALIATGTFQSKEAGITASGNFEIEETAGKFKLVIKSDFQVSEGPDLFFTFNPLPAAQVTGANAKTYALKIDPQLKTLKGAQSFDLPADFAVEKYQSLLIHCWKYNHLYAAATVKKEASSGLAPGAGGIAAKAVPGGTVLRIRREGRRLWAVEAEGGNAGATGAAGTAAEKRRFDFTGRSGAHPNR